MRQSWKYGVMGLVAAAGIVMGVIGYHAPRLQSSLGGPLAASTAGAPSADPAPAAKGGGGAGAGGTAASGGKQATTGQRSATAATSASGGGSTAAKASGGGSGATSSAQSAATTSAKTASTKSATTPAKQSTATASASAGGGTAKTATPTATAQVLGPLLSSTPYAQVAYQIYPGPIGSAAQAALSGFHVSFKAAGAGKEQVTISVVGGGNQTASFVSSDRLYIIETRTGDDGFGQDTNFGDDGFILTDAKGHIVEK